MLTGAGRWLTASPNFVSYWRFAVVINLVLFLAKHSYFTSAVKCLFGNLLEKAFAHLNVFFCFHLRSRSMMEMCEASDYFQDRCDQELVNILSVCTKHFNSL